MAVQDKYIDSRITGNTVDKMLDARASGAKVGCMTATFEVAAADDDGSVYRVFKSVDPHLVPIGIQIGNDALTSGTDWDLGFYKPDLGVVVDANNLVDGADLSSAHDMGWADALDGMDNVDVADYGKTIYQLAGHDITNKLESYDIALTANTVGSAAGTVTVALWYLQG